MRDTQRVMMSFGLLILFLGIGPFVHAQDTDEGMFSGQFLMGYRLVNIDGVESKYNQHINLDDGARLFNVQLNYEPPDSQELVDLLELDATNLGGDPFETFRLSLRKYGKYDFSYQRRKSVYFYEDIMPHESFDFHTFNFERTIDTASLNMQLTDKAKLHLGFNRYDKEGNSTTTLDVSRDEFEFDKPVDEVKNEYRLALDYKLHDKVTVVLEEKVRDYENTNSLFLPGASIGEDPEDPTVLDYFFYDQPYDYESFAHTIRINSRPTDRLTVLAAATIESLDMDVHFAERGAGIAYTGDPFTSDLEGTGSIERDIQLYDADLSFLVTDRVMLVGGVKYHDFEQNGDLAVHGEENIGEWDYSITGVEGGVQFQISSAMVVTGGLRHESREVDIAQTLEGELESESPEDTKLTGIFGNFSWRISEALRLTTDYQLGSVDDPFTLASPTDHHRFRARARYVMNSGFSLTGSYLLHRFENDNSEWTADQDQVNLHVGYRRENFDCALGYGLMLVKREVDQEITTVGFGGGDVFEFPILYEGETHLVTGRARLDINDQWAVGGNVNFYDNTESEPVTQLNLRSFVEVAFANNYLLNVSYRYVDFEEEDGLNDYSANIGEFSVGYRW